jgi:PAS domain S-box-containing protein
VQEKTSTRRPWLLAKPSFPDALARIRRDGLVLETFLPSGVGAVPPEERWDGRHLADILGEEIARPWIERIHAVLESGCFSSERFHWTRPESPMIFEVRLFPRNADEILVIASEVGYRGRLEAERNAMHALLQRTTDLLPDLVYVFDHAEERVVFQNRSIAEELGYPPERVTELGEFPVPALAHPDDLAMMPEILARTLSASDDDVLSYEGRWRAADGSWRWYVTHSRVFARREDGTPTQVFGVMRDVTEQRALEQQLHRAAKVDALGVVAGSIAHDFNNALTAIHGFAALIEAEVGEAARSDFADLRSAIDGAMGLASRVLSFSRAEHRRLDPIDLAQLVRKVEPMLAPMLGPAIQVELELPAEAPVVRADPREMEQVIVNLALNARDAMPKGGHLRIGIEVDAPRAGASFSEEGERWVRLLLSDTGEGMSQELQERAFEPFFTTKENGTGLGLASARLAVEFAGGTLEVASAPGRGTSFLARLPWCATPPLTAVARNSPAPAQGRSVLVVDDEPMVMRMMDATLRRAGYHVRTASGHAEALAIAADASVPIDLLISDVIMPGMTGPELAQLICELRAGLPVLFVSGFHDESMLAEAGCAGNTLLRKPFSPRQLAEQVALLLSPRRHPLKDGGV